VPDFIMNSLPGVVIMLIATLIGAAAYRRSNTKQLREIQNQVIDTYKTQNEAQEKQIIACERSIARLERIIETLQQTFEKRGLHIEINGEVITLTEGPKASIVQIRMKAEQDETTKET